MAEPVEPFLDVARNTYLQLAGRAFTPAIAKLYSQYTRIAADQASLVYWRPDEARDRLDDGARLVDAALLMKEAGDQDWHVGMRRAAELLEWLGHPKFGLEGIPIPQLAAAAYQVAGYPAMAASLLDKTTHGERESKLLQALLKADFPRLLKELSIFWQKYSLKQLLGPGLSFDSDGGSETDGIEPWILREIASAMGVLCTQARWGDEQRFDTSLRKLASTSALFLHGGSTYSWMLSRLVSEAANLLRDRFFRSHLPLLAEKLNAEGRKALELYARYCYLERKSVLWPSQILGLKRLQADDSFALCTPTGSGKTTIAEIALLQSLFSQFVSGTFSQELGLSSLALYLVPSRALAAEVESKLSRVLRRISSDHDPITVTGLYGGTDWGPTDAWLSKEEKTVLICTYEKAEALIRFLGPLFLDRVRLVVIDEAHAVEFNGRYDELRTGESRPLRLESLGTRLLSYVMPETKVIALSAVAGAIDDNLASWVKGKKNSQAVSSSYRSTRQLVGRLQCYPNRHFEIRYDLLDGADLRFSERGISDTPFIQDPFPPYPPVAKLEKGGPEKKLRPYLFWAALHLVKSTKTADNATVLIFVPQQIGGYAEDLLSLLETYWINTSLPNYFVPPASPAKAELWNRCLESCADYFTEHSREYRLLKKGIIVHHGKMPRLLSRLLVEAIEERIANVVLATSTLAEGVNLPFEVLLIPTLRRGQVDLSVREFANLVGRTGRPGVSTEGRSLVLLPRPANDWSSQQAWQRYKNIIGGLSATVNALEEGNGSLSPLAELLGSLKDQWQQLPSSKTSTFEQWLEETEPLISWKNGDDSSAVESLDVLDSILLSLIVELEQLRDSSIEPPDLEEHLKEIWRRSYSCYASSREAELSAIFVSRAIAISREIYPDAEQRRRLYRTNLPPRAGLKLIDLYDDVRKHLATGNDYVQWSRDQQFAFISKLAKIIRTHPKFKGSETLGNGSSAVHWTEIMEWWLKGSGCKRLPEPSKVSDWYDFAYYNFDYRFNWALSSMFSMEFDQLHHGKLKPLTLEDWPATKLPWIAFWIKELVVWGTLDPMVAFCLSQRKAWTRLKAEAIAKIYYRESADVEPNAVLDPRAIRAWLLELDLVLTEAVENRLRKYPADLLKDFSSTSRTQWRVIPTVIEGALIWLDPAGFPLAKSKLPAQWDEEYLDLYDFVLQSKESVVLAEPYV